MACAFFLAKVAAVYLGKAMEVPRSVGVLKTSDIAAADLKRQDLASYQVIVERDIFDSTPPTPEGEEGEEGEVIEEEPVPTGEAVLTSLSIKVLGVLVVGDGEDSRSSATISGGAAAAPKPAARGRRRGRRSSGPAAKVYAVGDEESFAPNTVLQKVQPDRIEFLHNNRLEYAEVLSMAGADIFGPPTREPVAMAEPSRKPAEASAVRKEAPGQFVVDQAEVNNALQNLDKLYTEIRAVPNFSGGKVSGMKILSVKSGSIFAKLGLRRGDVLQKINGMELDVKRGFEIFNSLKDQKQISLDLIRQGQPTTLDYEIR